MQIRELLNQRILVLDGAMGSMIQRYKLTDEQYGGEQFKDASILQKGNNDLLCLTQPDIISDIHRQYLEAGADIIETNSLNLTSISMADYGLESYVRELNLAAVRIAREVADKYTRMNPDKPRFVAGSVGPTNKTASISPNVSNPAYRAVTFDQLRIAYCGQITALIEGGVDALLIETAFDTLNVKAALMAAEQSMLQLNKTVPIMVSFTLAGKSGRLLSGQTLEAALASISHANLLSVGLNCSFGAQDMKPFLKELRRISPYYIIAYPNAGLPNSLGQYDETPEMMASQIKEFIDEGLVNIVGGCCGTTPAHIDEYGILVEGQTPRIPKKATDDMELSGLEMISLPPTPPEGGGERFVNIGERCNVAGSRHFLKLIAAKQYADAVTIAVKQTEDGAQILDINMDDAMLDAKEEMVTFLNYLSSDPDASRLPVMIDSSKWEVIEAGLQCLQGKSVVNSISLKEGEEPFLQKALTIRHYGAAVVVMAFDEKGQADTFERKIEICERAYTLLTKKARFLPQDIIFDPNVLAVATGIEEHNRYAIDFIRATEWIKNHLPLAKVSGGISNLSFSFRGNNTVREAMHSVFLYHAIRAGLDMGIVNAGMLQVYESIESELLQRVEDVIFDKRPDATERLIELAEQIKNQNNGAVVSQKEDEWRRLPLDERLSYCLMKGIDNYLDEDLDEALKVYDNPLIIIEQPLMNGMNTVGELFGEGKMFLPQVVKTARTMKRAVAILQPYIEENQQDTKIKKAGKVVLATVKGDVHDIGKNIFSVIMSCNNYEVIDLGVMVPAEQIIQAAIEHNADVVGLSGLITPSLEEMGNVAALMQKAGLTIPLLIGGATTSKVHTAVKIAPHYSNGVAVHARDASQGILHLSKLLNISARDAYVAAIKEEQKTLLATHQLTVPLLSLKEAQKNGLKIEWKDYQPVKPTQLERKELEVDIQTLAPFIDWRFFFKAWKIIGNYDGINAVHSCVACKEKWLANYSGLEREKAQEALTLYNDAIDMLSVMQQKGIKVKALLAFFEANANGDKTAIEIKKDNTTVSLPVLRQQAPSNSHKGGEQTTLNLSLADFLLPASEKRTDYIGVFATSVCGMETSDDFSSLLAQSLSDRLAEAAAEWLHVQVRCNFWGYAPDKKASVEELHREKYQGIRPAVGYPSLPDLSLIFDINKLLHLSDIGIQLTENGAMNPASSACGLLFAHPQARYFMIGKIGDDQRKHYAAQRGISVEETLKWLPK